MRARVGLFLTAVALTSASGCAAGISGSGSPSTAKFDAEGFKAVEAHSAFEVNITRADKYSVAVTTDENLMQYVKVTSDGQTLTLSVDRGKNLRPSNVGLKVAITMPDLDSVRLTGACTGTVNGFSGGKVFKVDVEGASKLQGDVDAEEVKLVANGASSVTLKGKAEACDANGNGASHINLGDFRTARAKVTLTGASGGTIHATEKLDYELSGASHLEYDGHPTLGKHGTSGASSATEK